MFRNSIQLFNLMGFPVRIDISWVILALLIAWTLALGYFPLNYEGLSPATYWMMGIAGALGLFISIILHELSHSLMARHYGLPMGSITLFIFGGIAEMREESPNPKTECLVGIIGPITSLVMGLLFYGIALVGQTVPLPVPVLAVTLYLAMINVLLAIFNLIPAFPLDGGRVLRAILWAARKDIRWATRISSRIGAWFGTALIVLGIFSFLGGNLISGIWWSLIGAFLRAAARSSYQDLIARDSLDNTPVRDLMEPNPVTVPPDLTLEDLVEDYVHRYYLKLYPVVWEDRLLGSISLEQVKACPKDRWPTTPVRALMTPVEPENTLAPDADAKAALSAIHRTGGSRLMVAEGNHLVGILSLKDLMKYLSVKMALEEAH